MPSTKQVLSALRHSEKSAAGHDQVKAAASAVRRVLEAGLEPGEASTAVIDAAVAAMTEALAPRERTTRDDDKPDESGVEQTTKADAKPTGWPRDLNFDVVDADDVEKGKTWRPTTDIAPPTDGDRAVLALDFGIDAGHKPASEEEQDDVEWPADLALAMTDPRFDVGGSLHFSSRAAK